jgi:hypothetical protein
MNYDYKKYLEDKNYLSGLLVEDLETINKSLFRKRLKGTEAQFRDDVRAELTNREYQIRVQKKSRDLLNTLRVIFCAKEALWKNIRDGDPGLATKKLYDYGRMIGLRVNDMSNIPTNIWTTAALLNLVNGKAKLNTDEHFYSLYANAGPDMIFAALEKDIRFDIDDLGFLVYKYNQTIKATCQENNVLGVYHRNNKMIDPETSYREVGVSQLVMFPQKNTLIKDAWHLLFEQWELDPNDIEVPFSNVITLEKAAEMHPELKKLLPEKDSINTSVVENLTVETTLEEK